MASISNTNVFVRKQLKSNKYPATDYRLAGEINKAARDRQTKTWPSTWGLMKPASQQTSWLKMLLPRTSYLEKEQNVASEYTSWITEEEQHFA